MPRRDVLQLLQSQIKERNFFDPQGLPIHIASAPARLDVLGGPGAQVGSTLAQMTLPNRTAIALQLQEKPELTLQADPPNARSALDALLRVLPPSPPSPSPAGMRVMVQSDTPPGAAQASTTALLTAALVALSRARGL